MPTIPRRYGHFVFGILQSGLTCAIAAAIADLPFVAEGSFAGHWLRSWAMSWLIMLPVVVVAAPVIRRAVERVTGQEP
ncbi:MULTISPECIES: DUF2798 domain-containing protein [Cupriavidus]